MNRAIPRQSSSTVVTLEPACHAGGRGSSPVAPVKVLQIDRLVVNSDTRSGPTTGSIASRAESDQAESRLPILSRLKPGSDRPRRRRAPSSRQSSSAAGSPDLREPTTTALSEVKDLLRDDLKLHGEGARRVWQDVGVGDAAPEGCQNPSSARNPSFDTLHSRRASSTRAFASMRMSSPSNRSRRTRRRLSTHAAGSRHCRLLARAPEPQRSPGPNSSEPRLLGVDLLALLFDRGGAG
jgi:hypothetical protein